jgi:hypothetical protein
VFRRRRRGVCRKPGSVMCAGGGRQARHAGLSLQHGCGHLARCRARACLGRRPSTAVGDLPASASHAPSESGGDVVAPRSHVVPTESLVGVDRDVCLLDEGGSLLSAAPAVARGADHVVLAKVRAISLPKARISGRLGPGKGVTCTWRADPAGRTSAPGPKVTEARARRGAELEANDRDPRGQPHSPVGSRSLFLSRGHPTRGLGGPEQ